MERSEPTLVPEWLRCTTGNVTGGGTTALHHIASSSSHTDVSSPAFSSRNRSSRSSNDKDSPRSSFLDRSSSSNSRRSASSNSSVKHPYSSFTRSHREKNRDKDKERSAAGDLWDHDSSHALENILTSRVEKNSLRRSHSLISRKPAEFLERRENPKVGIDNNQNISNGILSGGNNQGGIQKAVFEKDFPSLGTEEKQAVSSIGRVSSPVLSTAVQSLPIGNSGLLGGEKWTSALAEVPPLIGSNGVGSSSVQQNVAATPVSGASSGTAGLNMAEALTQAPVRARVTPQVPDKTQRLEELAIKQSRQLIPMTPTMPKALVPSASDKSKQPRTATRTSEMVTTAKTMQPQPYSSQLSNQPRGGQVRPDASNASHVGKFLVLKPARENGVPSSKDVSSPTNNLSAKVVNGQLTGPPLTPTGSTSPSSLKVSALENRAANLSLKPRSTAEKRPGSCQVQSRNDFFNLMRKKTSVHSSTVLSDSSSAVPSTIIEKSVEETKEVENAPESPCVNENTQMTSNGETHEVLEKVQSNIGEKNLCMNGAVDPDEEEAKFLRSLGWEENAGEEEGLTEEEINEFYQEYLKLKPSLKRGSLPKFLMRSETDTNLGAEPSESSSSASDA